MGLREFWGNRSYWQRGAAIGLIFGFLAYFVFLAYAMAVTSAPFPYYMLIDILFSGLKVSLMCGILFGFFGFLLGVIRKEEKTKTEWKKKFSWWRFFKPDKVKLLTSLLLLVMLTIFFILASLIFQPSLVILPFFMFPFLLFLVLPFFAFTIFIALAYFFGCYISRSKKWLLGVSGYLLLSIIIILVVFPYFFNSRYCNTDSDCRPYCGCGCMNKHSICTASLGPYHISCALPTEPCRCINNVCEMISYEDFNTVEECYEVTNIDACILNLAWRNNDVKICDSIEDHDNKLNCKEKIMEGNVTIEFCKSYIDQTRKSMCLTNLARKLKDPSICNEIEDESRGWCMAYFPSSPKSK